ncbi:hypothetical protein, partial [Sedimenticola sp.]|uniref:hypothetical protein n=1 Tax=Sedimenticola sp. TaxID=1940285 RepID=UPI003D115A89
GVAAELHLFPHHNHEFAHLPSMLRPVQQEVAGFLERVLVEPERYREENLRLNPFHGGRLELPPILEG